MGGYDTAVMGPRKKSNKFHALVGSSGEDLVQRLSEPKDYINELSHEVLCHIFRYAALRLHLSFVVFTMRCRDQCVGPLCQSVSVPLTATHPLENKITFGP